MFSVRAGREKGDLIVPIDAGRRNRRVRQPAQRDVVENIVSCKAFEVSVKDACDELVTARVVIKRPGRQPTGESVGSARGQFQPASLSGSPGENGWPALDFEHAEDRGRGLTLQDGQGHVVHGDTGGGFPIREAMMSMAMQNHVRPMAIDHFGQA